MFSDEDDQQENEAQVMENSTPQRGEQQVTPEHSLIKEEVQADPQPTSPHESQNQEPPKDQDEDNNDSDEGSSAKVIINLSFDDSDDNEASKDGNVFESL